MILTLKGEQAIQYVEQLGGSIGLSKFADPIEGGRIGLTPEEARGVVKHDPSLIYFYADTAHPDHAAIMERISE
jgi:hypothetical protein